jgi:hypothetical protein
MVATEGAVIKYSRFVTIFIGARFHFVLEIIAEVCLNALLILTSHTRHPINQKKNIYAYMCLLLYPIPFPPIPDIPSLTLPPIITLQTSHKGCDRLITTASL